MKIKLKTQITDDHYLSQRWQYLDIDIQNVFYSNINVYTLRWKISKTVVEGRELTSHWSPGATTQWRAFSYHLFHFYLDFSFHGIVQIISYYRQNSTQVNVSGNRPWKKTKKTSSPKQMQLLYLRRSTTRPLSASNETAEANAATIDLMRLRYQRRDWD